MFPNYDYDHHILIEFLRYQGEVVVDNRVDHKSYTSLHALVDDMFPPLSSHEQVYSCELFGISNDV